MSTISFRRAARQYRAGFPLEPVMLISYESRSVMSIAAVSPHLDDAALSASVALGCGGATVVTVFTALPAPGCPVTWWDRLTGATDSVERQRERLAEDTVAMRQLSATGIHLDEPEALYRDGEADLERAVERMTELLAAAEGGGLAAAS